MGLGTTYLGSGYFGGGLHVTSQSPTSAIWTAGGFVGSATANFTFSDDGVNWFPVRNGTGVTIPLTQVVQVVDYEGSLGFVRQYQAQVVSS